MITLKDVAQHARVSLTTASYALNGTGSISDRTRQRILKVADELNYHPNAFARNLKKQKSATLGVFIAGFGGSFYEDILEGIHHTILQTDYELIVCPESRLQRKILSHRQVDGAIIFDLHIPSELLYKLASPNFPIVTMDRNLKSKHIFPLLLDNPKGVREVVQHLVQQGLQQIAFIAGAQSFDNSERQQAFLHETSQHRLEVTCYQGNFSQQSGYEVGQYLIAHKHLPQAVFCANDQMAIGLMKALKEHSITIPQEVAVVGFDNIQISAYIQPSLSTVGAPRCEWGASAARQLIDFLEHKTPLQTDRLPTQLIERASSKLKDAKSS